MPFCLPQDCGHCLVCFHKVYKSYDGETLVVKDFNLDIQRGEFITMLGPSGSGKTTVLMMLAGFEATTHGKILINGRSVNDMPPHKRGLGMVFQNYALFPHMTVAENLAYPLAVRKIDKAAIKAKVHKVLDMVRLPDMAERRPSQLSGGQQQRVALARSLVFDPELVLMDEPLGALDKNLREEMQYEIKHIHATTGISVVYVTHDQTEALTMSNRVAVVHEGTVQQLASPRDLYEKPRNTFVAHFIGKNNQFDATVVAIDRHNNTCQAKLHNSNQVIHCMPANVHSCGEHTKLVIRPERVVIADAHHGTLENQLTAQVLETIYHGDHMRVRLKVCGKDDFIIKIPHANNIDAISAGSELAIGWAAEHCRALDYPNNPL